MTAFFDKLNLRPGEQRLVVFVALAVFVVLNIWFVWPQFGKVSFWENRALATQKNLKTFTDEIKRKPEYEKELNVLESLGGVLASEDQALQLQREVTSQAALSNVDVQRYDSAPRSSGARTNAFFEEQTLVITVNTGEKELVDFLYQLGAHNSLIRVKNMSLGPDPSRMRLKGNITLVESFQKKALARPTLASTAPKVTNPPVKPTSLPKAASASATGSTKVNVPTAAKTNASKKLPALLPPK